MAFTTFPIVFSFQLSFIPHYLSVHSVSNVSIGFHLHCLSFPIIYNFQLSFIAHCLSMHSVSIFPIWFFPPPPLSFPIYLVFSIVCQFPLSVISNYMAISILCYLPLSVLYPIVCHSPFSYDHVITTVIPHCLYSFHLDFTLIVFHSPLSIISNYLSSPIVSPCIVFLYFPFGFYSPLSVIPHCV